MGEVVKVRLNVFVATVLVALLVNSGCKPNPTARFTIEHASQAPMNCLQSIVDLLREIFCSPGCHACVERPC